MSGFSGPIIGLFQSTTVTATPGAGSWTAVATWRYQVINKLLIGTCNIVVSSAGTASGGTFTLPLPTGTSASVYVTYGNRLNVGTSAAIMTCMANTAASALTCNPDSWSATTYMLSVCMELQ